MGPWFENAFNSMPFLCKKASIIIIIIIKKKKKIVVLGSS